MRGDSVRDFYAKTLALIGLGVLAGTGALVDYWPVTSALPVPGQALQLPALASALPVPDGDLVAMTGASPAAMQRTAFARTIVDPGVTLAWFAPFDDSAPDAEAVSAAAPSTGPVPIERDALMASLGQEIGLSEPRSAQMVRATEPAAAPAPVATAADSSDFFIVTAFKKTGDSLATLGSIGVRTGAKTGTSILGAFRHVGGAVRKALPL